MHSAAALADQPAITAHFKPGFTAYSNVLVDSGLVGQLKPTELALYIVIGRFSTGFLRFHAIIGRDRALLRTEFERILMTLWGSRAAVRRAEHRRAGLAGGRG